MFPQIYGVVKKQRRQRPVRVPDSDRAERNLRIIPADYVDLPHNLREYPRFFEKTAILQDLICKKIMNYTPNIFINNS